MIPSFTGDGMSIALLSGIAAAQAVLAGDSAEHFQRRMIARLAPQFRWASLVNMLFETRRLDRAHHLHGKDAAASRDLARAIDAAQELRRNHARIIGKIGHRLSDRIPLKQQA